MAIPIQLVHRVSGITVYAVGFDDPEQSNSVWDGVADDWVEFDADNWARYATPLSEVGPGSRVYRGTWGPDAAGKFSVLFYRQLGDTPDPSDELLTAATDTGVDIDIDNAEIAQAVWEHGDRQLTELAASDITGDFAGTVGGIAGVSFPDNFDRLGITADGYIARVQLVDVTTTNTDMRGTNNALPASSYTAPDNAGISVIAAVLTAMTEDEDGLRFTEHALSQAGSGSPEPADPEQIAAAVWSHESRELTALDAGTVTGNFAGTVGGLDGVSFPGNFEQLAIDDSGTVTLAPADGVADTDFRRYLLAYAVNPNTVTDNFDGTRTVVFRDRSGGDSVRVRYRTSDGQRSESVLDP